MLDYSLINDFILHDDKLEHGFRNEVIKDFWLCAVSREASILGRKDVLLGKAKFGITGDGKEVPQVALARAMKKGDWRAGYYRDQTLMFALGISSVRDFFSQLFADTENDPFSGGRQMNNHFATPMISEEGEWLDQRAGYNISSDVSCTAGQMARSLGLAVASKMYRGRDDLQVGTKFSSFGDEVCICTIGDASTSEGVFWETINAATVLKVPLAICIWDDGYGISVPKELQTTKGNISKALEGFLLDENGDGIHIYTAKGWDYPGLVEMFEKGIEKTRKTHIPVVFHILELTQPQGHSTSGSHERYKSQKRLQWERNNDCIKVMGEWMVLNGICTEEEIIEIKKKAKVYTKTCRDQAGEIFYLPIKNESDYIKGIFQQIKSKVKDPVIEQVIQELDHDMVPLMGDLMRSAKRMYYQLLDYRLQEKEELEAWILKNERMAAKRYHTNLYDHSPKSGMSVKVNYPEYDTNAEKLNGYQILNSFFDKMLTKYPNLVAFGEDVGMIGGVNQCFAGLQEKHGDDRVFDTGIREWTIIGQGVGLAMRGWRPIAEIQYLDYLVYALPELTDDLATLRYRSNGIQTAPVIIRTRGHRLEGIWHAGSPMGMIINSLRGIYVIVPRDMTRAAGFYQTLLQSNEPGLIIECLNGYRLKESMPNNLDEISLPLGMPEVLLDGQDVTVVTYGSCVRVALEACHLLADHGISVELIDVQTLIPFDLESIITNSIKKTNRVVFLDEDVPGGATAYMMSEVLEKQGAYYYLDAPPCTITATSHRPPYGSDGDYFSKPNPEDVFENIYRMIHEANPEYLPELFPGLS